MKSTLLILSMAIIAISCSKNDTPATYRFSSEAISIYSLDSAKLSITPAPKGVLNFKSTDMRIAQYKDNGYVSGIVAGDATITAEIDGQKLSCKVTVKTKTVLCKEPYMGFSSSQSTVKANETRTIRTQSSSKITYEDITPNVSYISYVFESGKLTMSGIVMPLSAGGDALKFLAERYALTGSNSVNTFYFESLDKTIKVGLQISYPECIIGYTAGSVAKGISNEDFISTFHKLIN